MRMAKGCKSSRSRPTAPQPRPGSSGDVITKVNGKDVPDVTDFLRDIGRRSRPAGDAGGAPRQPGDDNQGYAGPATGGRKRCGRAAAHAAAVEGARSAVGVPRRAGRGADSGNAQAARRQGGPWGGRRGSGAQLARRQGRLAGEDVIVSANGQAVRRRPSCARRCRKPARASKSRCAINAAARPRRRPRSCKAVSAA